MDLDKFEQIRVGEKSEIIQTITKESVQRFAELTGDYNPLHMDDEFAIKKGFDGKVVHGMLSASISTMIAGMELPGHGSLLYSQSINYVAPAKIGDTLRIMAEVVHKSVSLRVVLLKINTFNQKGRKLLSMKVKVRFSENEEERLENNSKGAAVVTGSSRGIGAAIIEKLASDGFGVIINYRSKQEEAESVLNRIIDSGGKAHIYKADVRDSQEVSNMIEFAKKEFGKTDVLINNASGRLISKGFTELSWDDIKGDIDVHLKGSFNACKAVIPYMLEMKRGKIINIGSIVTDNVPPMKWYGYTIAKASLSAFTKSLAVEYGPKGLNINCIAPGMTDTMLIADLSEKAKMLAKMQNPFRRLAKPSDIANVVSFLASDSGDYISGETIRVCGGQVMV